MPYSPDHKPHTRQKILEAASRLFKRHGYDGVSIDAIMAEAGMTRGGFYAHFRSKEELFAQSLFSFLPDIANPENPEQGATPAYIEEFIQRYLSADHCRSVEGGCALVPLSGDVARAGELAQRSYAKFVMKAVDYFIKGLPDDDPAARTRAFGLLAMAVGGLSLARAMGGGEESVQTLAACRQAAQLFTAGPESENCETTAQAG